MKKPIVITDLAQLGHALDVRYMRDEIEKIESFYTQPIALASVTLRDGQWITEVTEITPQQVEELKKRWREVYSKPLGAWIRGADELFKIDNPNT